MSNVLIVDDEVDLRLLTRMLLQLEGHEVHEAADGQSALAALRGDHPFDVMLLDLRMPGVSGWEVLTELRDSGALDGVAVIVFSAHLEPRDRERAAEAGAVAYLSKPFTDTQLLAAMELAGC